MQGLKVIYRNMHICTRHFENRLLDMTEISQMSINSQLSFYILVKFFLPLVEHLVQSLRHFATPLESTTCAFGTVDMNTIFGL